MKHTQCRISMFTLCLISALIFAGCGGTESTVPNTAGASADTPAQNTGSTAAEEPVDSGAAEMPAETEDTGDENAAGTPAGTDTAETADGGSADQADKGTAEAVPDPTDTGDGESTAGQAGIDTGNAAGFQTDDQAAGSAGEALLTEDEAIAIVLKRVEGATADNIISFEKDYDDGRWQYEGELIFNDIEYEFEIDAQNGNILDWEIDD